MGKNRKQASLTNVVQYDSNFNLSIGSSTSSSFNSSGSIIAASGFTGSLSGSVFGLGNTVSFSSSVSSRLTNIETKSASVDISITNINSVTSSNIARLSNLESKSASVDISITNINSVTASNIARLSNLESKSSSVDISVSSLNTFSASNANQSLNQLTGSLATTGSNSFYGTQVFSGSVYIANDLVVQGSSSIQYISASSVSIGTNIIQLNTANPSVRFAGLSIIDSGSVGGSGSFLYDSLQDEFIFVHRGNGTNVTSSHFVLGPETYDSLGNELYLTCNRISKGTGKEHLVDSCIYEGGGCVGINTSNPTEKFEINIGGGARYGMAITGEYPYLTFNNCGSSAATARSFALTVTSAEAGDFAIKMSNCKNGNPITDGFDPFRISRAGDITITCSLTIAGCGLIMSGTGALTLPNGTTAQRPGTPVAGMLRYNNISSTTEYYNGCDWYSFSDNYVHDVDVLVVAGGGGGGINLSGAGGGGGVLYFTGHKIKPGIPISVIVGGGGAVASGQGGSSCIFNNIVEGGQRASQTIYHKSGNNGLITLCSNSYCYTSALLYCNVQGGCATGNAGAGGGGAGAPGANMCGNSEVSWPAKPGGCGAQVGRILDGINNYYWAGGGGGEGYGDYAGAGGCGGGGGGGAFSLNGVVAGCGGQGGLNPGCPGTNTNSSLNGGAGGIYTGGGGGGGSHTGASQTCAAGGPGGSGIIIIRYPQHYNAPTVTGTTPCICINCGYRSYIFLSSGTITF